MGTTQLMIPRLKKGGSSKNRDDTLARAATALNRQVVLSFPTHVSDKLTDAVLVA